MPVSVEDASKSVERFTRRFCTLVRSGITPSTHVAGLTWNAHDLVAHIASGAAAYREIAEGGDSPYLSLDTRQDTNQKRLQSLGDADLGAMADTIATEIAATLAAVRRRQQDTVDWHGGIQLPTTAFLGAIVGELMIHGLDLARTARAAWPMRRQDSLPAVDFFNTVTPYVVAPAARDLTAQIEVRYRGHDTVTLAFDRGELVVNPGRAGRADVHLSVDPVAFLLVGYRRQGLAPVVATGKAIAWGRRPLLAFRLPRLFEAP
jgi:hypothetical protein